MDEVDGELDKEVMDGGTNLLKKLEEADVGPWLVIHGHKHFASLSYGMTHGSCPPVLFSAGSLGALLYPQIKERTANQFYILTIDINQTESTGRLVGQFESYSWNNMRGWHPSQSDFLPYKGGFGSQVTPHTLVIEILKLLESTPYLDKNDLVNIQDKIDYYTPSQFKELLGKMDKKGLFVDYDGNQIKEVVNNEKSNN
ncbi:hypothetical protein [Photobacterium leiognathi]|uniref:hypothetical protein n=1 Tax=Photobacterium leiognathi TaxID=553611 RepID=UPI002738A96B|nr:hypothetical protein [Photobacterium leiognathi]